MKRTVLISLLSIFALMVAGVSVYSGSMPDLNCDKHFSGCVQGCDEGVQSAATQGKKYSECISHCDEVLEKCNKRQAMTTGCAEDFQECISQPDNPKDMCRDMYKRCKGDEL